MPPRRTSPRARAVQETAPVETVHDSSMPAARPAPFALILICVVLIVAAVLAVKNVLHRSSTPTPATPTTQTENFDTLVSNVARHIAVNTAENPSIATIEDPDALRLQNSVFYAHASVGDRLLIWSDKAVLYSPTQDKILAVLPLQAAPTAPTSTSSTPEPVTSEDVPTVQVRNGSGVAGLGKTVAAKIADAGMKALSARDATVRTPYTKTVIFVASSSTFPAWTAKLREITGGEVVTELPGEADLKGDIVVVLGTGATP